MAFEPITTQEDLDRIVGARLSREREKYADYDQIKAVAEEASAAIAERDELRAQLTDAKRASIAASAGIPVELVVGDNEEAMQAHADRVAEFISERAEAEAESKRAADAPANQAPASGPFVASVGTTPEPTQNPLAALFG